MKSMAPRESIILHLSDIQFGAHHRFVGCSPPSLDSDASIFTNQRYGNNEGFATLANKINDDLKVLFEEKHLRPNVLVISGDLAEWSFEEEYNHVQSLICSLMQSKYTDLSQQRVILVPGNHDVNWFLSEAYFFECMAHRKKPEPPYGQKYHFWHQFLQQFYQDKPLGKQLWHGFDLSEFGILVVALDSCIKESHRKDDHYGWLGISQVKEATTWFEELDSCHQYAHVAIFHHNPIRHSTNDDENLRDWDEVRLYFEKSVDLILHGHRHESYRSELGNLGGKKIIILGAGSAGLDQEKIPSSPNQYQIIKIEGQKGILYLRSYSEQAIGFSGKGMFRADADERGYWEYSFTLSSVNPVSSGADTMSLIFNDHTLTAFDEYVTSSLHEINQRLLNEQGKVGEIINLECVDVQSRKQTDLKSAFSAWLNSSQNRMVVLGAAGSGKTVSCLNLCQQISQREISESWVPIYIDLSRFAAHDDMLEIFIECFRSQGMVITKQLALDIIQTQNLLLCIDAFDEYERGGIASASDRPFTGFHHLNRPNVKILLTCRSNFFRRPEDIFIYELRSHEFELCPTNSSVVELLPLKPTVISSVLSQYLPVDNIPKWIYDLADRPLYLRMLVPLVRMKAVDLSQSLKRHELYEKFIDFALTWDVRRTQSNIVTLDQSRRFHVILAERFLDRGAASLTDIELLHLIEKAFSCKRTDDKFGKLLFFFQQSGLLRFEGGRIVFSHKSYREYLVAKSIYDLIAVGDDTFDFTWFTRNERDFIIEMLSDADKETLCRWLSNEQKYPACNYAIFILGGTADPRIVSPLLVRLHETGDPLVKINCANSLAALGSKEVKNTLIGIAAGYLLEESIITIAPSGCEKDALEWTSNLNKRFGRTVMLIHLCETIDALAMVGDAACVEILKQFECAADKTVADEAKGAIRRLVNRLSEDEGQGKALLPRMRRSTKRKQ
jgi:3',5'-cyclic AMP phosphodiesterase CpdA